ncbi:MAG: phage portal protein [Spirochaetota bacterium]
MALFFNNKKFNEYKFMVEEEFEKLVSDNSKIFFGDKTIYIDAKKKIETKALGGSIPDGFLFDFSDSDNPEFYLIEVELASHDFYKHIFPQITKFFAFFKNNKSQKDLIEKIYSIASTDDSIKKEFRKFLGEKEIFKFINDTIEGSQNILLIIDGDKSELPEIVDTYTDTWGKIVKTIKINIFKNNNDLIFSMTPDFLRAYYESVARFCENEIRPILNWIIGLIIKERRGDIYKALQGNIDNLDWEIEFNPLWIEDTKEKADRELREAQRDQIYVTTQVLSPSEVRMMRFKDLEEFDSWQASPVDFSTAEVQEAEKEESE